MPSAQPGGATLVIGLGNRDRGDDGVGIAVAERAAALGGEAIRVVVRDGDPLGLLDVWADTAHVVVVDAMRSGAAAGTVQRVDATAQRLPSRNATSSHGAGLTEAIELARALGRLPERLVVFGVEAGALDAGAALSPPCARAVEEAARAVLIEVHAKEEAPCTSSG